MGKIQYLSKVNSTNNYAAKLLQTAKQADPTVILTFNQYEGRGQRGNTWQSAANKDVAISAICYPNHVHISDSFVLSMAFSVWLVKFLEQKHQIFAKIKWPNDIYIGTEKVAGILVENQIIGKGIGSCILGLGLNVNSETREEFSATSISAAIGKQQNLELFSQELAFDFIEKYPSFFSLTKAQLEPVYLSYLIGYQEVRRFVHADLGAITAQVKGIDTNGKLLLLDTENQHLIACDIKEVKWIF